MKIKYFNGNQFIELDVSEEVAATLQDLDEAWRKTNRKERRKHHLSVEKLLLKGKEPAYETNYVEDIWNKDFKTGNFPSFQKMTQRQKDVFRLYYGEGKNKSQIARELHIHESTVRQHLKYALKTTFTNI